MALFSIGPVEMQARVLSAGAKQPVYFRSEEFGSLTAQSIEQLRCILGLQKLQHSAVLAASGTGAMEAALQNFTPPESTVLAINMGSFGQRFVDIALRIGRRVVEYKLTSRQEFDLTTFRNLLEKSPSAVLITWHETSTGELAPLTEATALAKEYGALTIVDAISSIGADPTVGEIENVDVLIFSSNKGLGLSPGASFVFANDYAISGGFRSSSYYFNLEPYFRMAEQGQTPYTPPQAVLAQLHEWTALMSQDGNFEKSLLKVVQNAECFRSGLTKIGLAPFAKCPSNAMTAFQPLVITSELLFERLSNDFGHVVNKRAFGFPTDLVRVGHLGTIGTAEHESLLQAISTITESIGFR